jgi:hypothetical protein
VDSYNAWHKESALKRAIKDEQGKKKVKAAAVVVDKEEEEVQEEPPNAGNPAAKRRIGVRRGETMQEHLQNDLAIYRGDCAACLEGSGRGRAHYRQQDVPEGQLSIDLKGPIEPRGRKGETYLLLAALTIPSAAEKITKEEKELEEKSEKNEEELASELAAELGAELLEDHGEGRQQEAAAEVKKKVRTLYIAVPMQHKSAREVLMVVRSIVILLKRYKLEVNRVHTDRGSEFVNKQFVEFCLEQGFRRTTTMADDKAANGRAEAGIGNVTRLEEL